jgi:hypothetical protein
VLVVRIAARRVTSGLGLGGSIAVAGCCLTAVAVDSAGFACELTEETLRRTSFERRLHPGARVNLERPMRARRALPLILPLLALLLGGCADSPDPKTPDDHATEPSDAAHHRLALTRALVEDNKLTPQDLVQLQLFVHGRIVLRRETTAGAHEVTKQHTLKVVDGRSWDEVVVDFGTPGVAILGDGFRVNFDPDDPDNGFEFVEDSGGRFKLAAEKRPGEADVSLTYGPDRYDLVDGSGAFLEIEEERLHEYITHQRKLPGARLP